MAELMNDPEIKTMMQENPAALTKILQKMGSIQSNPAEALSLLQDPDPMVQKIFQKLMSKMMGGKMNPFAGSNPPTTAGGDDSPVRPENDPPMKQPAQPPSKPAAPKKTSATAQEAEPIEEWERLKNEGNKCYKSKDFEAAIKFYDDAFEASNKEQIILLSNK